MLQHIRGVHGGARALLRAQASRIAALMGAYPLPSSFALQDVARVVFVCHGNICRSPFAAAYAASLGLPTTSAGIAATREAPAAPEAILTAREMGIDLRSHRALPLRELTPLKGDLMLGFEPAHYHAIGEAIRPYGSMSLGLVGMWLPMPLPHIQDPYATNPEYFRHCFRRIACAVENLVHQIEIAGRGR